jgi:hypothetical protein
MLDRNECLFTGVIEEAPRRDYSFQFYLVSQWDEWNKTRLKVLVDNRRGVVISTAVEFETGEKILIKGALQKNTWYDKKTKRSHTWYQLVAREIKPFDKARDGLWEMR